MENEELQLFIQIRDGQPYEHPITAVNFQQAFPNIDMDNLPDTFAKFIRVEKPIIDVFEVYEGVTYQWVDGVVKDVHSVRPMTEEEHAAKIKELETLAEQTRLDRIAYIDTVLADQTDQAAQTAWLNCRAAHEAWVMETVYPLSPLFPRFPIKNEDGSWVA